MHDRLPDTVPLIVPHDRPCEELFRQTFHCIPDAMIITRKSDGTFLEMNQGWERLFGVSKEIGVGKNATLLGLVSPEDRDRCLREFEAKGRLSAYPLRILPMTGGERDVEVTAENITVAGVACSVTLIRDVTEQKAARAKLEESEARMRALFDGIRDFSIISLDPEGRITQWNSAAEGLFGYAGPDILGKPMAFLYATDYPGCGDPASELASATATGRSEAEGWRRRKDGSRFWAHSIMTRMDDALGNLLGFVRITRDMTAKRDAETRIREREAMYRALAANIPKSIVLLVDPGLKVLLAEGTGFSAIGLRREDIEGKLLTDVMEPHHHSEALPSYLAALDGHANSHETVVKDRDFRADVVPLLDGEGKVYAAMAIARDVTEEIAILRALLERESNLRAVLDAGPDPMLRCDRAGTCLEIIPGLHGFPAELPADAAGRGLEAILPGAAAALRSAILASLSEGEAQVREFPLETPLGIREVEGRVIPFSGEQALIFLRDITASRDFTRFVASVASGEQRRIGSELHDGICQELTAVTLQCKALEARLPARDATRAAIQEISAMVRKTLSHTRALISGLYPVTLDHNLADGLREMADRMSSAFGIAVDFTGEAPELPPDVVSHLFNIAQEAVRNAGKHARARNVHVSLRGTGGGLTLEVSDDGQGFRPGPPAEGRGLEVMRYRARLIGARLAIEERGAPGCRIICRMETGMETA